MYETKTEDIVRAQHGDKIAMERILHINNALTWSIVKRFEGRGYETEDLYQIGCMGFIKAIKRFDTSFDVKMSTYAVPYILGEIKRFIRDDGPIRVSRSIKELANRIKIVQNEYLIKEGRNVGIIELAEILNVTKEEIAVALDSTKKIESIQADAYSNDNEECKTSILDKLSSETDETSNIVDKLCIKQLIDKLDNREKEIIMLRYFKEETQTEVAKILGITQVQVSRIERRVLDKMKVKLIG